MSQPSRLKGWHSIPDEKTLSESYALPVYSHDGKSTPFGELVSKDSNVKVIAIFGTVSLPSCSPVFETATNPSVFESAISSVPAIKIISAPYRHILPQLPSLLYLPGRPDLLLSAAATHPAFPLTLQRRPASSQYSQTLVVAYTKSSV